MGWTNAPGADLAQRIEELVHPADIFSFDTSLPNEAEPGEPQVHALVPITPSWRFTLSDHRTLSLLLYFRAVFPNPMGSVPLRRNCVSLEHGPPRLCTTALRSTNSHRVSRSTVSCLPAPALKTSCTELVCVLAGALVTLVSGWQMTEGYEEIYTPGLPPAHIHSPRGSRDSGPGIVAAAARRKT
jgi:hypothetical protein